MGQIVVTSVLLGCNSLQHMSVMLVTVVCLSYPPGRCKRVATNVQIFLHDICLVETFPP